MRAETGRAPADPCPIFSEKVKRSDAKRETGNPAGTSSPTDHVMALGQSAAIKAASMY